MHHGKNGLCSPAEIESYARADHTYLQTCTFLPSEPELWELGPAYAICRIQAA